MSEEIRAEIVGSVTSVLVADGAAVTEGDTLVLLESMKMELPVVSETGGTVRVSVAVGDVVQRGDLIAVVD
jgi:acetyl-CoA carboxylase biotin carboxyl carrier protein